MSFYKKDQLEQAQARVREAATSTQRKLMDDCSAAVEIESQRLDEQFTTESKLRTWAAELCGIPLDMTEIERFRDQCRTQKPGMFYFKAARGQSVPLVKTAFGTVDRAENYLNVLERTVVDVTNNSQFTALPTSGLIKLVFKRLFKRSK